MERSFAKTIEVVSHKEKVSSEMAFVAIVDTSGVNTYDDRSWQEKGACAPADNDAFYPNLGETAKAAKKICGRCSVREICLEYALDHKELHGVWGGLTPRERRKELAIRRQAKVAA